MSAVPARKSPRSARRLAASVTWLRDAQSYLHYRKIVADAEKPRDKAKRALRAHVAANGTPVEGGHLNVIFPEPFDGIVEGTTYYGMQLRNIPGPEYFETDEVAEFAASLAPEHRKRIVKRVTTTTYDTDELYVLEAEGVITEDQLRALIHRGEGTKQLWPIEADPS